MAPSLRTRTPQGSGLSCPQPAPEHPARWVRFSAPRPWVGGWVEVMTALQASAPSASLSHTTQGTGRVGSRSRPAALAGPRAQAATATAALPRARPAHQKCRNRRIIATQSPHPRNPGALHSHPCDARPESGAGCVLLCLFYYKARGLTQVTHCNRILPSHSRLAWTGTTTLVEFGCTAGKKTLAATARGEGTL